MTWSTRAILMKRRAKYSGSGQSRCGSIAIKPSPSRWSIYEKQKAANDLIRKQCEQDSQRLLYVDIVPAMLGSDGQPPPELFVKDMLHMSPAGYKIWNEKIHKLLEERKLK